MVQEENAHLSAEFKTMEKTEYIEKLAKLEVSDSIKTQQITEIYKRLDALPDLIDKKLDKAIARLEAMFSNKDNLCASRGKKIDEMQKRIDDLELFQTRIEDYWKIIFFFGSLAWAFVTIIFSFVINKFF